MIWRPFVREPQSLWQAWQLSKSYGQKPSTIYGITEQPAAFYFDRAVATFGARLENDLAEAENKAKSDTRKAMAKQLVMNRWLGTNNFARPGR